MKTKLRSIIPGTEGKPTFAKLTRQPTGMHMLDSGGDNGRQWQRKLPSDSITLDEAKMYGDRAEIMASIPLHTFLDNILTIDVKLTKLLRKLESEDEKVYTIFGASEAMQLELDMVQESLDYTYNWSTDLSQDFQFAILRPKTGRQDYYNEGTIVLIQTHNGCDARGGFSDTVVCRTNQHNEITDLFRTEIGWVFLSGKNKKGKTIDYDTLHEMDERFQDGYTEAPTYEFCKEVVAITKVNKKKAQVTVKLKDGSVVTAYPSNNIVE